MGQLPILSCAYLLGEHFSFISWGMIGLFESSGIHFRPIVLFCDSYNFKLQLYLTQAIQQQIMLLCHGWYEYSVLYSFPSLALHFAGLAPMQDKLWQEEEIIISALAP